VPVQQAPVEPCAYSAQHQSGWTELA
jgi:hypothetical protein